MIQAYIARIQPANYLKRLVAVTIFVVACAFGISCYYAAGLGADTISVFVAGISRVTGWTLGTVTNLCNLIIIIIMVFFGRRYLGPGTLVSLLLTGFSIDFFVPLILRWFPVETTPLYIRALIVLTGLIVCGIFIGLYVFLDFGVGPFDFFTLTLRDALKTVNLRWVRIATDLVYLVIGWLLGGPVGVGTIVAALLTGPLMSLTIRILGPPLTRFLGKPFRDGEPAAVQEQ